MSDDRDEDRKSEGNWILEALGPTLERVAREQAAAEAHAASCTTAPCERCDRRVCGCGLVLIGQAQCRDCAAMAYRESRLKPTRDSIPTRFKWAIDPPEDVLVGRVRGSAELVRKGLKSPPSTSLLFMGPTGAGKTSLAVAMLDAWVRAEPNTRKGAMFIEAAWLSRARARHRLGADEAPLVAAAMTAPLVLLDDLGQEREDRDGCITDVIYGRGNADLPTWVTCGLATQEQTLTAFAAALSQRYDGGFVRRIVEHGRVVSLGGQR